MDRKYQVFISSTYMDLNEVRMFAYMSILELGHIPVSLNMFDVQKDYTMEKYIAKYIDACEFVILIVGERYGSISQTNKSYVEEEYIYSISKSKPVLCFLKSNYEKVEDGKYQNFVMRILSNQVVVLWDDINDFKNKFVQNISRFLVGFSPSTYWIKTSKVIDGEKQNYLKGLETLLGSNTNGENSDILGLMLHNLREIEEFYSLTKGQAKRAFYLSVGMCISGFLLFAFASVLSFLWKENLFALLTALGGVVVEVIAGTSLLVYKRSLEQLNFYYSSLHDNERFLSLIKISEKTDCKDVLYTKIVESELERFKFYDDKSKK